MHRTRFILIPLICVACLSAHPLGNFSVNHYARILPGRSGAVITYVLDFAEVPTFDLLQKWNLRPDSPVPLIERKAEEAAQEWVGNLQISIDGARVQPRLQGARATVADGAAGMKVMRVAINLSIKGGPGKLTYEDANFVDRDGWKEIVIGGGPDRSHALTAYPADATSAPPQQLNASLGLGGIVAPVVIGPPTKAVAAPQDILQTTTNDALSYKSQGDFLSNALRGGDISFGVALICLLVAFGLGAMHAFEPGHGKTMVAAYLVGSRGTPKHAALLGFITTFTHTISVFGLGFVTLFLSHYIMPEKMTKVLGVLSGVSIIWIGGLMLYRRSRKLMAAHAHQHHHHHHHHDHGHPHHDHGHHHHDHDHRHNHDHADQHAHHHVPEGDITMGSLVALGASGGLVPCPAALILLLTCISLGRPGFGMLLLLSFSLGLAIVLMAVGLVVLYARNLLPERHRSSQSPLIRALPVISAAVILLIGVIMTGVSLGWLPSVRLLG